MCSNILDDDPYLYPCSSNNQCSYNTCHMSPPDQPDAWFCDCEWDYTDGAPIPCTANEYCCTNICNNGYCVGPGGTQGTVCGWANAGQKSCAPGYVCTLWGDYGYCNFAGNYTTPMEVPTTGVQQLTTSGTGTL